MAAVRNAFVAVDRAERARTLYPERHPARSRADEVLWRRVTSFLEEYGDLVLDLSDERILYRGREIQRDTPGVGSLARRLFDDGIRRLTIHAGITREELVDLVEILSLRIDPDDIEQDLATYLGERGFTHVTHLLLQPADGVAVDASLAGEEWRGAASGEDRPPRGPGTEMDREALDRVVSSAALSPEEAHRLQEMVVRDGERDLLADYEAVLRELLHLASGPPDRGETYRAFAGLYLRYLAAGRPDRALGVLETVDAAGTGGEDRPVDPARDRVQSLFVTRECLSAIDALLGGGQADLDGPLGRLLERLGPPVLPRLLARMRKAASPPGLREVIEEILLACPGRIARELRRPDPGDVLPLLDLVAACRLEEAIPAVLDLLRRPEPPVRAAAVRCLLRMGEGPARTAILAALRDPDESLRLAVIRVVEEDRRADLAGDLLRLARDGSFLHRSLAEKQETLRALAVVDPEAALPFLRSLLRHRFLRRRHLRDELRAAAAFALGFLGREEAREELFRHVADRSDRVRDACLQAIRTFQNLHAREGVPTA